MVEVFLQIESDFEQISCQLNHMEGVPRTADWPTQAEPLRTADRQPRPADNAEPESATLEAVESLLADTQEDEEVRLGRVTGGAVE
jgi:hypothetical protein